MQTPQNQPLSTQNTMKYFKSSNTKNPGKYVAPRRRKRQEPEEWVKKPQKKNTFKKIDNSAESFPALTNNSQTPKKEPIKYDIKKLFENRRKKREKKNKIPEGYVRLYFKNGKPCKEYGILDTPPVNNDEYFYHKKMYDLNMRELQAEELAKLDGYKNEYIPYWIEESKELDDYEEECSDYEYSTDSDYEEEYSDEDPDFYDMN